MQTSQVDDDTSKTGLPILFSTNGHDLRTPVKH